MSIHLKSVIVAVGILLCMAAPARGQTPNEELIAAIPENFPPYYMLDSDGQPTGYAIDTLQRLANSADLRIRYLIRPDWDSTMEALRRGEADLIPNLGITADRAQYFAFTAPLETFGLGLFVRSVNTDIHSMDDLAGKSTAVVKRNAAVKWIKRYPQADSRLFDNQEQALFALLAGEVDAFIYPITVTWKMAADIGVDERIRQAGLPLMEIKRAVAVRKDNQALLQRLDRAVRDYTGSEQFGETYARWHAKPRLFWTLERVLRYGSVIVASLLALIALGLWWWRHHSVVRLQRELQQGRTALAHANTEIATLKEQLKLSMPPSTPPDSGGDAAGQSGG